MNILLDVERRAIFSSKDILYMYLSGLCTRVLIYICLDCVHDYMCVLFYICLDFIHVCVVYICLDCVTTCVHDLTSVWIVSIS